MGKKNLIKKSLVYAITGSMLFSSISPALAYTYKDSEPSFTTQEVNENKTSNTTVYAELGSEFHVTIPKHIILDGTLKRGSYVVAVTGDIAGTEIVKVVPDASFALTSNNLANVTAYITQDKTEWVYSEMLTGSNVIGKGEIDASGISAGSWNGNFNFNVSLEENSGSEVASILILSEDDVKMGSTDSVQVNAFIDGENVNDIVSWNSDNENIIVTNGLVETKANAQVGDTATVTVSATSNASLLAESESTETASAQFTVTIIDMAYTASGEDEVITSIDLKAGESKDIEVTIIPASATGTVSWTTTAPSGINLIKNGNTVTVKIADDMAVGNSYDLVASYGNFSKLLKINIVADEIHTHSYTSSVTTEATCTTVGVKTFTCACGDSYTESISATGHSYKDGSCEECGVEDPDYVALEAGLYNANGVMLCSWENSGIDVESNYTSSTYNTNTSSPYYVLTKKYPTTTKVVLPNNITTVGDLTFTNCTSLTNIEIPNSVTSIGSNAFGGCKNLTNIEIPNNVTNIGEWAFTNCTSLTNIEIPNNVTSIGKYAFVNCTSLTDITISDSVTSIELGTFSGCTNLESIIVPGSIISIGQYAFKDCTKLTSVTILEGVTNIGIGAFGNCTSLTNIKISNSVTSIDNSAFLNCINLTSIIIPEGVTQIVPYAFRGCTNLTSVIFEDIENWYVGTSVGTTTTNLTVDNSLTNATYLKSTYLEYYWIKQ